MATVWHKSRLQASGNKTKIIRNEINWRRNQISIISNCPCGRTKCQIKNKIEATPSSSIKLSSALDAKHSIDPLRFASLSNFNLNKLPRVIMWLMSDSESEHSSMSLSNWSPSFPLQFMVSLISFDLVWMASCDDWNGNCCPIISDNVCWFPFVENVFTVFPVMRLPLLLPLLWISWVEIAILLLLPMSSIGCWKRMLNYCKWNEKMARELRENKENLIIAIRTKRHLQNVVKN